MSRQGLAFLFDGMIGKEDVSPGFSANVIHSQVVRYPVEPCGEFSLRMVRLRLPVQRKLDEGVLDNILGDVGAGYKACRIPEERGILLLYNLLERRGARHAIALPVTAHSARMLAAVQR